MPINTIFVKILSCSNFNGFLNNFFFQLESKLFYKYGVIYREVMHSPRFEWCRIAKLGNDNKLIAQMLTIIRDSAPQIIHECPYTVNLKLNFVLKLIDSLGVFLGNLH